MTQSTERALVPAVRRGHPPRLGDESRFAELIGGISFFNVGAFLAVLALGLGLFVGPRTGHCCGESKSDIARMTVKKYAFEAYPSWSAQHPDVVCPARLEELNEYMNNKDIKDPWGGTYAFSCDGTRILVWSHGEDGLVRTDDDLWSDR